MDFKHTLEIVTKDIQDTEKLVGNFKNYSGIPRIELDLALSKLQNVYELLLRIRNNQEQFAPDVKSSTPAGDTVERNDISPEPVREETVEENDIMPETIERKEIKRETKQEIITEIITRESEPKPSGQIHEFHSRIIAEKFSGEQSVIHEKLRGNSHKTDISEMHQLSPIRNIAGSMGINDKFYYIRELFNGDAELFRQTLEALDASKDYTSALSFVSGKFNWNMDSKPAENLMNLVKRKFIIIGNE